MQTQLDAGFSKRYTFKTSKVNLHMSFWQINYILICILLSSNLACLQRQRNIQDMSKNNKNILINTKTLKCKSRHVESSTLHFKSTSSHLLKRKTLFVALCVLVVVIIVCVPREALFVKCNHNLRTADIGLSSWNQICFVRVFPETSQDAA